MTLAQVLDVYGRISWVAADEYANPARIMLRLYTSKGRSYGTYDRRSRLLWARHDSPVIHRGNISRVLKTKEVE